MKTRIEKKTFDAERSLYGQSDIEVCDCTFSGPADGESPLKETKNIVVKNCRFDLRYPFWHVTGGIIEDTTLSESCRAALWYDEDITIRNSDLGGIKALRECSGITIRHSTGTSAEFAWRCRGVNIEDFTLTSEYPFFECRDMDITGLRMTAKYSFQYAENVVIRDSVLKTKDAFWHSKNLTILDSVVEGEYLGWYSENLKLIRCRIVGTQPLCYAKGLVLEDCTMEKTDLSFEKSHVEATVKGGIDSVKNPLSGFITADAIGEIILDDPEAMKKQCRITVSGQ